MKIKYSLSFLIIFCLSFLSYSNTSQQAEKNRKVKVLLAGDSTMQDVDHSKNLDWGWGQLLPCYFDDSIEIINFAKGGRSTRSFTEEGRWDKLIAEAGNGDYVFIQFGHNDAAENKPERYTPIDQYRKYLEKFITESREKGTTPILVTPVTRRKFKDGKLIGGHGEYTATVKSVAKDMNVLMIDLEAKSSALVLSFGEEKSKEIYMHLEPGIYELAPEGKTDNTHFSRYGAYKIAGLIIEGINELKLEALQKAFLSR